MRKVKILSGDSAFKLEEKVNQFAENHNIIHLAYSVTENSYGWAHFCMVLYEDL